MSDRSISLQLGQSNRGYARICARYANRHGLITGATGSGKTRSLVRLASEFNRLGVPVFAPDLKGDLAELVTIAAPARVPLVRLVPGRNFRLSLRDLGGDLAARAMSLSDAQRGALDSYLDAGCSTPAEVVKHAPRFASAATERALFRGLGRLDGSMFDARGFDVAGLVAHPAPVTVLHAKDLAEQGASYAVTLTYMLRELYTRLPEVGDRQVPVLAFFVDEAHMLFNGAPADLVAEIERMVRLIRSRGVSLWFVTQSPADLPDSILAQLQNRIQHSLRAVTPKDWRGVKAAIDTMPAGGFCDPIKLLGELPPGKALVSLVGHTGQPRPTELCEVASPLWVPREASTLDPSAVFAAFMSPAATVAVQARREAGHGGNRMAVLVRVLKFAATVLGIGMGLGLLTLSVAVHAAHPHRRRRH